ncbi:MAG: hypothetical protein DRP84_09780 [Spirochaetes bacterium]|nr:MAG: hypothetical protein DRP84_09780 [Spirochaetota bacterium]
MSAPGKRRISFLGDSYTVGHGIKNVDKRFANQVRNMMKDEWEVQVLAGNGLDTGAELYVLESYIKAGFQFDNLILIYCLNDISDIIPKFKNILKEIYKGKKSEGFFLKNSYFINLLYYRFVRGRNPNISNYYGFVRDAYYSNHWEDQKNRLHLLCKLCHSRGINLMVVTFPFLHALDNGYEYGEIHEKLNKFWKEQKIPYLDLLSIYEGHKASELIISRYDAHPNEYAHSLAAEAIKNFIIRKD